MPLKQRIKRVALGFGYFLFSILLVMGYRWYFLWTPVQEVPLSSPMIDDAVSSTMFSKKNKVEEPPCEEINRIPLLFQTTGLRLPIVQTIEYSSRVNWLLSRPAWLVDYAAHYQTSKHFIARSLYGYPCYEAGEIHEGSRFNVLRTDVSLEFYLLVDLSKSKMRFYYLNPQKEEKVLLKTYSVAIGRSTQSTTSGFLTPLGSYRLGSRVALYRPGQRGYFRKNQVEMVSIFGTRWIPFEPYCHGKHDQSLRGLGFHGTPWKRNDAGEWEEASDSLGPCSDGCIRLKTADMEELFSIVVTRPTVVEIVGDFSHAQNTYLSVNPQLVSSS